MDAQDTPSIVGESPRPAQDASSRMPLQPATAPLPPPLRGLYASPKGPCVLIFFPEQHETGLPLVPKQLEDAADPDPEPVTEAIEPLEFEILYRSDAGALIQATVRIDPASLPAPAGSWVIRRLGDNWVVRVIHAG